MNVRRRHTRQDGYLLQVGKSAIRSRRFPTLRASQGLGGRLPAKYGTNINWGTIQMLNNFILANLRTTTENDLFQ